MKTPFAILALVLLSGSAQAWEIRERCAHSRFYGTSSCRTVGIPDQPREQRDYQKDADDHLAKQERIKKWEAFCKPARRYDDAGVARLVYARNGCEFGRAE